MRLEHHLVGGYVRYITISPHIIIMIIISTVYFLNIILKLTCISSITIGAHVEKKTMKHCFMFFMFYKQLPDGNLLQIQNNNSMFL